MNKYGYVVEIKVERRFIGPNGCPNSIGSGVVWDQGSYKVEILGGGHNEQVNREGGVHVEYDNVRRKYAMTQGSLNKKKGIADIVFLLDVSGSMTPCLDALKANIGVLIDGFTNPGSNADAIVKDWRIKVSGYSDYNADGSQWWQEYPFTDDPDQVRENLASLEIKGGGDEPESLLDGLWMLAKMPATDKGTQPLSDSWRYKSDAARVVIIFTDASCHMELAIPEAGGAGFEDVVRKVQSVGMRLSVYCPEADCYHSISSIDKAEVEFIGSLSDAVDKMAEFTSNTENFEKTLDQLAKSISASAVTPEL